MKNLIYLDHNILDALSKEKLSLRPSEKITWVYSNENLNEIKRASNTRFLDELEKIKAQKIELVLDDKFRITNQARLVDYKTPFNEYENYISNISGYEIDTMSDNQLLARLFGGDNHNDVLNYPSTFEENIKSLLEPHDLYTYEISQKINKIKDELVAFVTGPLQEIDNLEKNRALIGTNKGKANHHANNINPIDDVWKLIQPLMPESICDKEFFGFTPIDKQNYDEWPEFLGICSCHTILNYLGYSPDRGLNKAESIPSILSDGVHIGYASFCQGLMSRDKKLLAKANAIYRFRNIPTILLNPDNL